jgi:hypothetical protein
MELEMLEEILQSKVTRNEAFVFGDKGMLSPNPHCQFFKGTNKTDTLRY